MRDMMRDNQQKRYQIREGCNYSNHPSRTVAGIKSEDWPHSFDTLDEARHYAQLWSDHERSGYTAEQRERYGITGLVSADMQPGVPMSIAENDDSDEFSWIIVDTHAPPFVDIGKRLDELESLINSFYLRETEFSFVDPLSHTERSRLRELAGSLQWIASGC